MIRLAHFSQPESQGPAGHRCGKDAMKFQEVVGMGWVLALVKDDTRWECTMVAVNNILSGGEL